MKKFQKMSEDRKKMKKCKLKRNVSQKKTELVENQLLRMKMVKTYKITIRNVQIDSSISEI
jgi:hypothetical protein